MRLTDLQPIWLAAPRRDEDGHEIWPTLTSKDGAHGISLPTAACKAHFYIRNGDIVPC